MKALNPYVLLVILASLVIPFPQELSLSGRNWTVGFPIAYIEYRANFPARNYGVCLTFIP